MNLIDRLAWIAKIDLNEDEKKRLEKEIQEILKVFEKISEVDTEDVEYTLVTRSRQEFREETLPTKENTEDIIKNFPDKEDKKLKVPRFL